MKVAKVCQSIKTVYKKRNTRSWGTVRQEKKNK